MINIKPTDRDLRLMFDLYEHSFLSFYQIHEEHFKKCALPTVYNRLAKLINAKLIESIRVNLKAIHRGGRDIGVIYSVTKNGLRLLKKYHIGTIYRETVVPINFNHLYHDLLLTDGLKVIERSINCCKGVDSKLLVSTLKDEQQTPDGVIFKNKEISAFEVELTAKSNIRYREIIYNYSASSSFKKVLYLVKDDAIRSKIGGVITGYAGQYKKTDDTGKFYFCTVKEFFGNDGHLKFTNGVNSFEQREELPYNNRSFIDEL